MNHSIVFRTTEDQADRFVLSRLHHVFSGIVQIEIHLPGVGMSKFPDLKINHNKALQPSVEKQEVHMVPFVADANALLSCDERESIAKFEQEPLQVTNERIF